MLDRCRCLEIADWSHVGQEIVTNSEHRDESVT